MIGFDVSLGFDGILNRIAYRKFIRMYSESSEEHILLS